MKTIDINVVGNYSSMDDLFDALFSGISFGIEDKQDVKSKPRHSAEEELANAILFGDGRQEQQASCGSKFDADKDVKDIADKLLGKDKAFSRQVDELTAALWTDLLAGRSKITPTLVSSMNDRRLLAIIATSLLDKEKSRCDENQ